jgi:hypothetical protein
VNKVLISLFSVLVFVGCNKAPANYEVIKTGIINDKTGEVHIYNSSIEKLSKRKNFELDKDERWAVLLIKDISKEKIAGIYADKVRIANRQGNRLQANYSPDLLNVKAGKELNK